MRDWRSRCPIVNFAKVVLSTDAEVRAVLNGLAAGPKTAAELIQTIPTQRQAFVFRALAWLVKLGGVEKSQTLTYHTWI